MSDERCFNCKHPDPHTSAYHGWASPTCEHRTDTVSDCDCTADQRTIAALRAEVERLKADAKLGAMLVRKAKEVAAMAPHIPRLIVCNAVAAALVERLSETEPDAALAAAVKGLEETGTEEGP